MRNSYPFTPARKTRLIDLERRICGNWKACPNCSGRGSRFHHLGFFFRPTAGDTIDISGLSRTSGVCKRLPHSDACRQLQRRWASSRQVDLSLPGLRRLAPVCSARVSARAVFNRVNDEPGTTQRHSKHPPYPPFARGDKDQRPRTFPPLRRGVRVLKPRRMQCI